MKHFVMLAVLIAGFAGCGPKPAFIPADRQAVLTGKDNLLFPGDDDSVWIPESRQTERALSGIFKYLMNEKKGNPEISYILEHRETYGVQFFGMVRNGRKRIFCNFFPFGDSHSYWKEGIVLVFDGGAGYWSIEYDVEKDECGFMYINGEA